MALRECDFDRRLPTLIWESWFLGMSPTVHRARTVRQALSLAVAILATGWSFEEAKTRLGASIKHSAFNSLFDAQRGSNWDDIAIQMERLANYLLLQGAPIDYRRRRGLDYAGLLPRTTWIGLYVDHDLPRIAAYSEPARIHLTERLSGLPVRLAGTQPRQLKAIARIRTPSFAQAINRHCLLFLKDRGVQGEPAFWSPVIPAGFEI